MWLFDLLFSFLNSANVIFQGTDISKYLEVRGIADIRFARASSQVKDHSF